jgi:hypothetical protein
LNSADAQFDLFEGLGRNSPTDPLDTFMGCRLFQHLRLVKQNAAAGWEGIQDISQLDAQAGADVSDDRESAPVIRVRDC